MPFYYQYKSIYPKRKFRCVILKDESIFFNNKFGYDFKGVGKSLSHYQPPYGKGHQYVIGDPIFLHYWCGHPIDEDDEFSHITKEILSDKNWVDEYKKYLKSFRLVSNTLGIMKNWYRSGFKHVRVRFQGGGSTEWLDESQAKHIEGRHYPYGFRQDIDPQERRKSYEGYSSVFTKEEVLSNKWHWNREYDDHYDNYNNTVFNSKNGSTIERIVYEYDKGGVLDYFKVKRVDFTEPSNRQLTFILDRICSPKTYVKRHVHNVIYNRKYDIRFMNLIFSKHYDKYLSEDQRQILKELREDMPKQDVYTYSQGYTPDSRYVFTCLEYKTRSVMGRGGKMKTQRYLSPYIKQFPPYPYWCMYDPKIDSYLVDLAEFESYAQRVGLFDIDCSLYPFADSKGIVHHPSDGIVKYVESSLDLSYGGIWEDGKEYNLPTMLELNEKEVMRRVVGYNSDIEYKLGNNTFTYKQKEVYFIDADTPLTLKINKPLPDAYLNAIKSLEDKGVLQVSKYYRK